MVAAATETKTDTARARMTVISSSPSTTTAAEIDWRMRRRRRRRGGRRLTAQETPLTTSPPSYVVFVVLLLLLALIVVDDNMRIRTKMTVVVAVAASSSSDFSTMQYFGCGSSSSSSSTGCHRRPILRNRPAAAATSGILRGGGSRAGGRNNTDDEDKEGEKKRKKQKLSNEKDDVDDDQNLPNNDGDRDGDETSNKSGEQQQEQQHRFSSFGLLTSPFQIYDAVRKEASGVVSNIMAQAEELAKQYEEEEEEAEEISRSKDSASDNEDIRDDHSKGKKKRNKNRNKKNKKRRGIQTAETLIGGFAGTGENDSSSGSGTAVLVRGDIDGDDDDGKEGIEKAATKDTILSSIASGSKEGKDAIDVGGDQEENPSSSESHPESSNGSKLWWANIWSDLMDESSSSSEEQENEEAEEEEDLVEDDENIDSTTENLLEPQVGQIKTEQQSMSTDGQVEKKTKDGITEETDLLSDTRGDTRNVTVSSSSSDSELLEGLERNITDNGIEDRTDSPSFVSSGAWVPIDNLISLGLASRYSAFRVSRSLRGVRKMSARVTGLHGILSGKPSPQVVEVQTTVTKIDMNDAEETARQTVIRKRIAAIDRAREGVRRARAIDDQQSRGRRRNGLFGGFFHRNDNESDSSKQSMDGEATAQMSDGFQQKKLPQKTPEEIQEEKRRMDRVREIDRLIQEGQASLQTLICEKDVLQRRPNPLFEYTTTETVTTEMTSNEMDVNITEESSIEDAADAAATSTRTILEIEASRKMAFPPNDLVDEYIDMMLSTRRLINMNHTHLWQEETEDDEEETIGDDLFTPSANARSLYQDSTNGRWNQKGTGNGSTSSSSSGNGGGGGSWLLRQSIGSGPTLGEKIGEAAETAAYKAVCKALMSFLARLLSSLHGINVLKHSDIRLVLEQTPDLPPLRNDDIFSTSGTNYAEETIKNVMRRKTRKSRAGSRQRYSSDDSFVQRDAVTEMLLSHVQISAPLLKLFPLAWQRALLGNIITLSTAVISDFLDGLSFQILGHQLSFSFRPITQEDLVRQFRLAGGTFNHRRYKPAEFEAAVRATAEDLSEELKFLDKWHERALGSGVLRTQIANLIARIVLTLTDEILSGAKMELWSSQANGPRILAGLEYRTEEDVPV